MFCLPLRWFHHQECEQSHWYSLVLIPGEPQNSPLDAQALLYHPVSSCYYSNHRHWVYMYLHADTYTCRYTFVCADTGTCTCRYMYMQVHVHADTCMCRYMYMQIQVHVSNVGQYKGCTSCQYVPLQQCVCNNICGTSDAWHSEPGMIMQSAMYHVLVFLTCW